MKLPENIVLASASPRRQSILTEMGVPFEVIIHSIDEDFPSHLNRHEVAVYLAEKKAAAYHSEINSGKTVITADTIVCLGNAILNKPANKTEAFKMLKSLSGTTHDVITAVCIRNKEISETFYSTTSVEFADLDDDEINHYIELQKPFDKAGGYGIQEWIGMIGISKINGSYYNVVGLPAHEVYSRLKKLSRKATP